MVVERGRPIGKGRRQRMSSVMEQSTDKWVPMAPSERAANDSMMKPSHENWVSTVSCQQESG